MNRQATVLSLSISVIFTATACSTVQSVNNPTKVTEQPQIVTIDTNIDTNITKSPNDKRDYAYTQLDNGLKLLVISDPEAQRSAVAVDVNVGSASDPDNYKGLAHFLEHMLFLGTDKYPQSGEFQSHISKHGGSTNAYTAFDHTNYHFDIDPSHLHGGLQRFSRFFVAPLMSEKYVQREREAVNSEYQTKIRDPYWRRSDVFKQALNPQHPYARFNIGNLDTLPADSVRPALLKLYKSYYSADRMSAVIIGKENTDTLLQWGRDVFAEVPKRDRLGDIEITESLFANKKLPLLIKSQSLQNKKSLNLNFILPYSRNNDYTKSESYLSHVLGYEGEGSLLATLKKSGYVSSLGSGRGQVLGKESTFNIGMELTDKGYNNTNKVLAVVFDYITLLQSENSDKQSKAGVKRYNEMATIAKTAFEFRETGSALNEVGGIATHLNRYPVKDVLALPTIYQGYQQAEIAKYLSLMTVDKAVVQLTAPDIKPKNTTKYFSVPYSIEPLDTRSIKANTANTNPQAMHLPHANPFIADDYSLQMDALGAKQTVLDSGVELYYKNDTSFAVPRSSVQISLQPTQQLSIQEKTAMSLLVRLLNEQLNFTLYDAGITGLSAGMASTEQSLLISLKGYQQKMPELLTQILQQLHSFNPDQATFARIKTNYKQDLQNFGKKTPFQQTFAYLNKQTVDNASLPSERLAVVDQIDEQAIIAVKNKILSSLAVRMMVYGNNNYPQAKALAQSIPSQLKSSRLNHKWQGNFATVLKDNVNVSFDVPHAEHAISYYIQADKGYRSRAEVGLLGKLISAKFFNELRTHKQLGYIVFASPHPVYTQAGISFTIQSPMANADVLQQHIVDFNKNFAQSLSELSAEEFGKTKAILKAELLQKPENLITSANEYWSDIITTDQTSSSRKALANEIDTIELDEFVVAMQALLTQGKHVSIKAVPRKAVPRGKKTDK